MGNPSYEHLQPGELMEYLDGSLDPHRVRTHLRQCAQCRAELRELALVRILLSPPEGSPRRSHVPPDTLASYVEDRLTMEQNRAVEDHFINCARCLADYLELKKTMAAEPEAAVPPELSAQVLSRLEGWRNRKPVGALSVKRFLDQIGLVFRPAPRPPMVDDYTEHVAANNFAFGKHEVVFAMQAPSELRQMDFQVSERIQPLMEGEEAAAYLERAAIPALPRETTVSAGAARIRLSIQEKEGATLLVAKVMGMADNKALPGVKMELVVKSEVREVQETDRDGHAIFVLPDGRSTLLVHLDRVYEIEMTATV